MSSPVPTAIVGASGYTGEELVRIALRHPGVELVALTSRQLAGQTVADTLGLRGEAGRVKFEDLAAEEIASRAEVVFLALPHGVAAGFAVPLVSAGKRVFDLSADFRLKDAAAYAEWYGHAHPAPELLARAVYALPEFNKEAIATCELAACPGCYPTSVQLALVPLLRAGLIDPATIIINAISGVSGAGKKAETAYLYCECNENLRAYGVGRHRHIPEIEQELTRAAGGPVTVTFTPHLAPLTRGMLTTCVATCRADAAAVAKAFSILDGSPFVRVLGGEGALPETRHVAHNNGAELAWRLDGRTGRIIVVSAIDNLGKGAAGQAMQAFNIRHGFPEEMGLAS